MNMTFRANGYESALMALQAGRPVVLQTAEGAHVVMASRHVSPDAINLMATHARGLVSMAISPERCAALGLSTQPRRGRDNALLYTQSIEAREGVATGISAADRALTVLAADQGGAGDIACPGHVFPYLPDGRQDGLAARVLRLMAGAGLGDTAVTCLILDAEGETASPEAVAGLASALGFELLDAAVL